MILHVEFAQIEIKQELENIVIEDIKIETEISVARKLNKIYILTNHNRIFLLVM